MRITALAATGEESREASRNLHGDWTFLRPHEWVPEVPVITREEPQVSSHNSRKTRKFSPPRDEALFRCGNSREIPPFLLSLERVLDIFDETQKVPQHTCLHSRGTPRVLPQLEKSPVYPSSSPNEGPFPCFVGKGIPAFLSHLKRRRSPLESREELQGSCHHSKRPRCPNPLQIHLIPLN